MPDRNELLSKAAFPSSTTAAADTASVVTLTAPSDSTRQTLYITGLSLSASGAIGTAVAATLTNIVGPAGTAVTLTFQLPASAIAPMVIQFGPHPLQIVAGQNAVLTLPALGGSIVGTATLYAFRGAI